MRESCYKSWLQRPVETFFPVRSRLGAYPEEQWFYRHDDGCCFAAMVFSVALTTRHRCVNRNKAAVHEAYHGYNLLHGKLLESSGEPLETAALCRFFGNVYRCAEIVRLDAVWSYVHLGEYVSRRRVILYRTVILIKTLPKSEST